MGRRVAVGTPRRCHPPGGDSMSHTQIRFFFIIHNMHERTNSNRTRKSFRINLAKGFYFVASEFAKDFACCTKMGRPIYLGGRSTMATHKLQILKTLPSGQRVVAQHTKVYVRGQHHWPGGRRLVASLGQQRIALTCPHMLWHTS